MQAEEVTVPQEVETITVSPEVRAEIVRIRAAIAPSGGDKEDLIAYAKEVVSLRHQLAPSEDVVERVARAIAVVLARDETGEPIDDIWPDYVSAAQSAIAALSRPDPAPAKQEAVDFYAGRYAERCGQLAMAQSRVKVLEEALRKIADEAERPNGSWVHLKRVIGINARQALIYRTTDEWLKRQTRATDEQP